MELILLEHGFDFLIRIDGRYRPFRLANLPAYRLATSHGFKEMEAGWQLNWQGSRHLGLLEMKAWYDLQNPKHPELVFNATYTIEDYANENLAQKAIDMLRLLEPNVDQQVGHSVSPRHCIPADISKHIDQRAPLLFIFLIKTLHHHLLAPLRASVYQHIIDGLALHNLNHHIEFDNVLVINEPDFRTNQKALNVTTRDVI